MQISTRRPLSWADERHDRGAMSVRNTGRIFHFFGIGVLDQILLSGINFIGGFVMIRYTSDVSYGQYVLAQSAILLLVSAQGAWLSGPVTMLSPSKTAEERARMIGFLGASQTRVIRRAALILLAIPVVSYLIGIWSLTTSLAVAAMILAGWGALQREFRRGVLLIYARSKSMLGADAVYVATLLLGVSLAVLIRPLAGPVAILGLSAAAWAGALVAHRLLARDPGWQAGDATPYWLEIRTIGMWSLVGAAIYWLFAQSYNYVLATRLDLTAVTNVNAARLVLTPVFVFMYGINNLLMPMASRWLAEFGMKGVLRRLAMLTVLICVINLLYFAVVWTFRNWLIVGLMHKHIADQDRLLILWGCVAMVFLPREVLQSVLWARKQVRPMAWVIGVSAIVSLTLMWFGIAKWGAAAVLIGQVAGECANIIGLSLLLWRLPQGLLAATAPVPTDS
jgi:O-antigen/teichoic acid export membrane protein